MAPNNDIEVIMKITQAIMKIRQFNGVSDNDLASDMPTFQDVTDEIKGAIESGELDCVSKDETGVNVIDSIFQVVSNTQTGLYAKGFCQQIAQHALLTEDGLNYDLSQIDTESREEFVNTFVRGMQDPIYASIANAVSLTVVKLSYDELKAGKTTSISTAISSGNVSAEQKAALSGVIKQGISSLWGYESVKSGVVQEYNSLVKEVEAAVVYGAMGAKRSTHNDGYGQVGSMIANQLIEQSSVYKLGLIESMRAGTRLPKSFDKACDNDKIVETISNNIMRGGINQGLER